MGEAIEVSGPAGTNVTGWTVVLYNGNGGAAYNTQPLSGTIPATCGARGVLVLSYPSNGIQNGAPDGMALVDARGAVVEFLSYEGCFAATNGPALGLTSADIGVREPGTSPPAPPCNATARACGPVPSPPRSAPATTPTSRPRPRKSRA